MCGTDIFALDIAQLQEYINNFTLFIYDGVCDVFLFT